MWNTPKFRRFVLFICVLAVAGMTAAVESGPVIEKDHAKRHFNTRIHLRDLDCSQCHYCESPTREAPCLIECPRHMGNFRSDQRPDDGPKIVIIDQLANLYEPVPFSHELHAQMSDMIGGCGNCHHYSEQGGKIPPCRECHDPSKGPVDLKMPSLKGAYHRQCMNCHLDWSHENACSFCHEEHHDGIAAAPLDTTDIVGVKHPLIEATDSYYYDTSYSKGAIVTFHHADHVDQFGLACVDCHTGDSCSRCHDQARVREKSISNKTSCTECHEERGCMFCHDSERKPKFEHASSTGWPLGKRHEKLDCNECHGVPKVFHTPSKSCTSCHTDWLDGDFDHSVTGVVFNEDHTDLDCTDCHVDQDFGIPPSCDGCHDDGRVYDRAKGFGY
jgi:hypothetical protein